MSESIARFRIFVGSVDPKAQRPTIGPNGTTNWTVGRVLSQKASWKLTAGIDIRIISVRFLLPQALNRLLGAANIQGSAMAWRGIFETRKVGWRTDPVTASVKEKTAHNSKDEIHNLNHPLSQIWPQRLDNVLLF